MGGLQGPPKERFWRFVEYQDSGCWKWTGYIDRGGYGKFSIATSTSVSAHRFAYETLRGAIPTEKQIDHLCRNRWCVNPFHLELVTQRENVLRGIGHTAQNARKTHCLRGHLLAGDNLVIHAGRRECRTCINRRNRERYANRAAKQSD